MDLQFDSTCRACMTKNSKSLTSIFTGNAKEILQNCFQITVKENDGLPQKLCHPCHEELDRIAVFAKICKGSNEALWKLLETPIKEEIVAEVAVVLNNDFYGDDDDNDDQKFEITKFDTESEDEEEFEDQQKEKLQKPKSTNKPYQCDKCGKFLASKTSMRRHFTLNWCKYSTTKMEKRMEKKPEEFSCNICQSKSVSIKTLRRHFAMKHAVIHYSNGSSMESLKSQNEYGDLLCTSCGFKHKDLFYFKQHCITKHTDAFECSHCHEKFDKIKDFNYHMEHGHSFIKKEDFKSEKKQKRSQKYPCEICKKEFGDKFNLKVHMNIHNNARPHLCGICGKGFNAVSSLRAHEIRHEAPQLKCEYCSKSYYKKHEYEVHKRTHTNDRPFKCTLCDKTYTRNVALQKHQVVHTGERNYSCEYCPKKFFRQSHLVVHVRTHTGERPFPCEVCGQRFTQKYDMIRHFRRHKETD